MRWGFACAVAFGANPPTAPSPSAATPPATNCRRLTGIAASGSAQHVQRAKSLPLVADVMAVSPVGGSAAPGRRSLPLGWRVSRDVVKSVIVALPSLRDHVVHLDRPVAHG